MSVTPNGNAISLKVIQFPQHLLIPSAENIVLFQTTSLSNNEENFRFAFKGEDLNIDIKQEEFKKEIKFGPNETKEITLRLTPTSDGFGKLIIDIYWLKIVEYTVKIQKVRKTVPKSKIKKILGKKKFLKYEKKDVFDHNEYLVSLKKSDIKALENELKSIKENLEKFQATEINNKIKTIAKAYLSNDDLYKALEIAIQISNQAEQLDFYYNLLRAYSTINLEKTIQIINGLTDLQRKNEIITKIALDYADIDPVQINSIISIIQDPSSKDQVLVDLISKFLTINTDTALSFSNLVQDEVIKVKILFNIIKKLQETNNKEQILQIIHQINQIILNSQKLHSPNKNNEVYDFLKDSICVLAEMDCPEAANSIIKRIPNNELRENIAKDLFNFIYEMVDEIRTKIEPTVVFSQYYVLNIYASKITNELRNFCLMGGNASSNLLMKDYNFNNLFLSLFSFDFSIFPFIDRVYSDLRYNSKKGIAYYIFPTKKNHDEEELTILKNTLRQFCLSHNISKPINIFNMDFIPYLGKPTVILSSEVDDPNPLKLKIEKKIGNSVNVIIDDSTFKGGESTNNLRELFSPYNFKIFNLVLSYEFINDYNLLKEFFSSIV
ncbi:MAG: hypothetical protein ACFFD5_08255 [Candidatus Thorarchaeota archaeon]